MPLVAMEARGAEAQIRFEFAASTRCANKDFAASPLMTSPRRIVPRGLFRFRRSWYKGDMLAKLETTDNLPVAPRGKRPWVRFSLRAFLVLVAFVSILLGWTTYNARRQKEAIAAIERIDGYWYYDFQFEAPDTYYPEGEPPGPSWFWKFVDINLFCDVVAIGLDSRPATDDTIAAISCLKDLQQLDLAMVQGVTNDGLADLEHLDQLTYLRLLGTSIDSDKIDDYERRHPRVTVVR